jgi:hypothetical protein
MRDPVRAYPVAYLELIGETSRGDVTRAKPLLCVAGRPR